MDWLTNVPWIGPRIAAAMRTHAWRAFAHLQTVHWTRLAAAMTFTSFLSLFPLLALVAAVGAALLSQHQLDTLQHKISEQIPGIADQIDINGLVANAGTIGLIAGVTLLFTGMGWVASLRDCLRAVWHKDDEGHNPVVAKLIDGGVLLGLGAAALLSLAASGFATAAVDWTADKAGLADHGPGRALLTAVGFCIAVLADFLILTYLLTLLPGVEPPRRSVIVAALIGAVGFELLKLLLSGYLQGVAGKNVYGAFGTPVALLIWFNFMAKLLLYCAAWTATPRHAPPPEAEAGEAGEGAEGAESAERAEPGEPGKKVSPAEGAGTGDQDRPRDPDRNPRQDPARDPAPDFRQDPARDRTREPAADPARNPGHRGTAAGGAAVPR
jgi:membrane protein